MGIQALEKSKAWKGSGTGEWRWEVIFNIVVKELFQREHDIRIKTMWMSVGGHVEAGEQRVEAGTCLAHLGASVVQEECGGGERGHGVSRLRGLVAQEHPAE